jgi:uncharacterized membrane protein
MEHRSFCYVIGLILLGLPVLVFAHEKTGWIVRNIMYIVPLVGVFVLAFFGVTSERMASLTKKFTGTVKLLTALLFLALAGLLFLLH